MNTFGVIPTPSERGRPVPWNAVFTGDEVPAIALALTVETRHWACGAWHLGGDGGSVLICSCDTPLYRLEAVSP